MEDEAANAFRACDPAGPPTTYIIATGPKARDPGSHDKSGSEEDSDSKSTQRTVLMSGRSAERISDAPCGNAVTLVGVDDAVPKKVDMESSVSPFVQVAVQVGDGTNLPHLVGDVEKLAKADPSVLCAAAGSR